MDKLTRNKGYTLVEALLVCIILCLVVFITSVPMVLHNLDSQDLVIHYCQLEAMALQTQCKVTDSLWFNKHGNINQAQTISYKSYRCVFQLGFGRYQCEKQ